MALDVGTVEAVNDQNDGSHSSGVDYSGLTTKSGTAMITLRDPDNIQLEVFGGRFNAPLAAGRADH